MRVRNVQRHGEENIELQMTPMIDIVFQLLVFFIMTFKIVSPEGDFNIRMPKDAPSEARPSDPLMLPPIQVRLAANSDGTLAGITMGGRTLKTFGALHLAIREIVGDDRGPGSIAESTEVEFDCDYQLKFEYVIQAITAVSGYVRDNRIIKVIEKIKFKPPRRAPGG
ncbi:MAG: biopolymer transporter ExbD [Pirellulales bacterium]|nr:biopolymer transporter ExbD [Pirellulales bacterium]